MRPFVISVTVLIVGILCASQKNDEQIEKKVSGVENGLVEVKAPIQIFQAGPPEGREKMGLSERMTQFGVPGVSIAVINDYQIEWEKAYGLIDAGSDKPVDTKTVFEAASTTKLLASVIALRLVEQGQLDLDEDVNQRLKSWKIPESEFTAEKKVTLRSLLTHQSGLNRPDGGFSEEEGSVPTLVQVLKGEAPAKNLAAVVEFTPGTQWQYSNFGYLVIQLLLEDVLDKPFSQIAREVLFDPLGMKNSTLVHPLKAEFKTNIALPHDQEGTAHDRPQHPTALAQGGLVTTSSDLARFAIELMRAYQDKSDAVLSQASVQRMFTVQRELDPAALGGITGQGLGVFLLGEGQNLYFLYAGHNNPGATSIVVTSSATGKGAVIMTNGVAGLPLSFEILAAVADEYDWPTVQ
ncbi:MAG: beta-lactamase family protein [Candidatus Latescibacterota bacterium]|nr:MAG: beta-lactamase family protein [Candidatus Latescibacterota bacterium]